jgi:transcriptional regulator with XRE-family HTH domain
MSTSENQLGRRVREIREKLGINQEKLASVLGISRPAVSQIENGERRVCAEELRSLASAFNISVDRLLDLEKDPEIHLDLEKLKPADPGIRISVPQNNLQKFKEVLLYILWKVGSRPNVGETVLYKLLYFVDFDYYEKYEEQLVGASYQKNHYGPTPVEFAKVVEQMISGKEIDKVKSEYFQYPQTKYLPLRSPDLTLLKASEVQVIDDVLFRLGEMNASQISDYSHQDVPWMTTEEGNIIPYEAVFYRTTAYSVRDYEHETD